MTQDATTVSESEGQTLATPSQPRRPGGQPGNSSRLLHGGRSQQPPGFVVARLGQKYARLHKCGDLIRANVRDEIRRAFGREPTLWEYARIQSVVRLELSARISEKAIRENPDMPAAELRQHRQSITSWTQQRDSILRELLGGSSTGRGGASDPWAAADALLAAQAAGLRQERPAAEEPVGTAASDADASGDATTHQESTGDAGGLEG